jgi:Flp pilus assembly protein TadB
MMAEKPSRRDRLRPAELLGLSAGFALFVGLVVLLTTRQIPLSLVSCGVAFIATIIVISMLTLAAKPNADEKTDLDEQNNASR